MKFGVILFKIHSLQETFSEHKNPAYCLETQQTSTDGDKVSGKKLFFITHRVPISNL